MHRLRENRCLCWFCNFYSSVRKEAFGRKSWRKFRFQTALLTRALHKRSLRAPFLFSCAGGESSGPSSSGRFGGGWADKQNHSSCLRLGGDSKPGCTISVHCSALDHNRELGLVALHPRSAQTQSNSSGFGLYSCVISFFHSHVIKKGAFIFFIAAQ